MSMGCSFSKVSNSELSSSDDSAVAQSCTTPSLSPWGELEGVAGHAEFNVC